MITAWLLASLLAPAPAEAATDLYVALGDSITAGTMADTATPTTGARAIDNKKTLSWASGSEVSSHFTRLRAWYAAHDTGTALDVLNVAVPGSLASGLNAQLDEVVKTLATRAYRKVAYVTLLIGANDACSGVAADTLRGNLMDAFARIANLQRKAPVRLLVSSIPQIPELGRPDVRNARTYLGMTCGRFRDGVLGLCKPLLVWQTAEELTARLAQVATINAILRDSVETSRLLYPQLDAIYSNGFAEAPISIQGLASDCFHPNKLGQAALSELFWSHQTWFR